jgi:hypothetical protein
MFPTMEVRWFYLGQVSPEARTWFWHGAGQVEQYPRREDTYLRLAHTDALGIKLREGRIEVKQRVQRHGSVRFNSAVTGIVEHWRKWSFQLAEAYRGLSTIAFPASSWITVRKSRSLRTYRLTGEKEVVPVSRPGSLAQGCEVELTRVQVAGQDWWTLAFEAFGDEPLLNEQLVLVARHKLATDRSLSLSTAQSCGYPGWLASIAREEETM